MEKLAAHGAEAGSAVKKTTFVLLVKDTAADTTKIKEAKTFGIPIMTPDDFISKYQL
jgi:ribosomal protein S2